VLDLLTLCSVNYAFLPSPAFPVATPDNGGAMAPPQSLVESRPREARLGLPLPSLCSMTGSEAPSPHCPGLPYAQAKNSQMEF
jgi:hypothetical protein